MNTCHHTQLKKQIIRTPCLHTTYFDPSAPLLQDPPPPKSIPRPTPTYFKKLFFKNNLPKPISIVHILNQFMLSIYLWVWDRPLEHDLPR